MSTATTVPVHDHVAESSDPSSLYHKVAQFDLMRSAATLAAGRDVELGGNPPVLDTLRWMWRRERAGSTSCSARSPRWWRSS